LYLPHFKTKYCGCWPDAFVGFFDIHLSSFATPSRLNGMRKNMLANHYPRQTMPFASAANIPNHVHRM
jgi:hypothetical protein